METHTAIRVLVAAADLADAHAVDSLLAKVPGGHGNDIRGKLSRVFVERKPLYAEVYFEETRTAAHIMSDKGYVICGTVTEVTAEQAASIADECKRIVEWTDKTFSDAVRRALGPDYKPMH